MDATLYVIATPIGNLEDLSPRARRVLSEVGTLIAEDTRVARALLSGIGVPAPRIVAIHAHSSEKDIRDAVERLAGGERCALITDAGTPGISDPGAHFLDRAYAALPGLHVVPVPGPSAAATALSVSGFYADRFLFLGFPPHKKGRAAFFKEVVAADETVVFYESPHRIEKTLDALAEALDATRRICIGRELTKVYETIVRGPVAHVLEVVRAAPLKGEFVIVVERAGR
ncbi:16S rRNA (cytidine(1402)-2'-O)-methyltransferase [Patescibacteria group bacterium]|nr:MAG: 16S rRNA (cytidine(1402)-2'-O)-methyltransferase [Patescibacteria group bacterium]